MAVARMALVGPTASGKTALAVAVAQALGDVEIVSADSMLVYRGMDVGTAKPNSAERAAVPHHLLDLVDPDEEFGLAHYQAAAFEAVATIESRGRRPLLVGGTGLYVQAVVDELTIPGQFPAIRAELEAEAATPTGDFHRRLTELDPLAASRIDPANRRRVLRALEVTIGSGRPFSSFGPGLSAYPDTRWDQVGLHVDEDLLGERIATRLDAQLAAGFVAEVEALGVAGPILGKTAAQALGYRELREHLAGRSSMTAARAEIETRTRQFARRQRRWFGRDPRITWMDGGADLEALTAQLVDRWGA